MENLINKIRGDNDMKINYVTGNWAKILSAKQILDKPYLKPGYSGFELVHFPNKEPFSS